MNNKQPGGTRNTIDSGPRLQIIDCLAAGRCTPAATMADDEDEALAKNIPPPLPLWGRGVPSVGRSRRRRSLVARRYNFPRSHEQQNAAPPLTGFAHSLPIIKHRVARSPH